MAQPYVLGFVGENANGILRWWTEKILNAFAARGLPYQLVDLRASDHRDHLADILVRGKPSFCFSFQGMGMDLRLNGLNYWVLNEVPFFSYLGDNPYYMPALHAAEGPGLYFLYGCRDFLETYQQHMGGRSYATVLRYGYPDNPHADDVPWRQREHDVVFVKTAVDSSALRSSWNELTRSIRELLIDASARVLSGSNETVATLCTQAFDDRQIHWGERREFFLYICNMVDRYARAVRAERMVSALLPHNALIVGDWSHLATSRTRARFGGVVPATELDQLYAHARVLANTSPTVRFGMHERIMAGLFAKTAIISDTTPFLQDTLKDCPSFIGRDIDQPDFFEVIGSSLQMCLADPSTADKVRISADVAKRLFSFDDFIQELTEYVDLERHRRTLQSWAFPPRAFNPTQSAAA